MNKKIWVALTALSLLLFCLLVPAHAAGVQSKTFEVAPGGTLTVSTASGDILITTWEKQQVAVMVNGVEDRELDDLEMTQSGNDVTIDFHPQGHHSRNVSFNIQMPSQFNPALTTAGGDIEIVGSLEGDLKAKTAGGDIRTDDINGSSEMTTAGGDIQLGTVEGNAVARTSGGNIEIKDCSGDVDAKTSGGDITIGNVGEKLEAKTAGGDIKIGDVGGEANVTTAGGDIEVGRVSGSATLKTAGGDIECMGASGTVAANTAGGDVTLKAITGSVDASTAGGDVTAELDPTGQAPSELKSIGGDVRLMIPASASATIEATITVHGADMSRWDIRSDFKAQSYEKDQANHEIRGTYLLNGGGARITLSTMNADIYIQKAP